MKAVHENIGLLGSFTKQKGTNGQCKTQTAYCCFHHANENVTDNNSPIVQSPKSACSLHFTLPRLLNYILIQSGLQINYVLF